MKHVLHTGLFPGGDSARPSLVPDNERMGRFNGLGREKGKLEFGLLT